MFLTIGTSPDSVFYWELRSGEIIFYKGVREYSWKELPAILAVDDDGTINVIVLKEAQA